jgi:hypothetical protein
MAAAYAFGRVRGYEEAAVWFVIAGGLVAAGGWLAYYARVPVLGRYVSPGEPLVGARARWIAVACVVLMAGGTALVLWTVVAIGRA